jgi:hypothetical protein
VQGTAQVAALLGLYLIGFLAAVITARRLKSSVLKSAQAPFLLEMPSYRWPTVRSLGLRLLDRGKVFLRRAGTVILLVTVVLWVMAHVPQGSVAAARDAPDEGRGAGTAARGHPDHGIRGRSGTRRPGSGPRLTVMALAGAGSHRGLSGRNPMSVTSRA